MEFEESQVDATHTDGLGELPVSDANAETGGTVVLMIVSMTVVLCLSASG